MEEEAAVQKLMANYQALDMEKGKTPVWGASGSV
jgi:hypothetical protein